MLTLVGSEFGRRPQESDSDGSDHGAGCLVMVVGDRADGGVRTEFPELARLDRDDNLLVTTEFRTGLRLPPGSWLGVDAAASSPGVDAARLPLVR